MALSAAKREARRRTILDAARDLYAERGVESVRMEEIARAAGVTRRTLYAYFLSTDDLSLHVGVEYLRERWALQQQAMEEVEGAVERLRAWGLSFFEFAAAHPHSLHLQFFWDYRGLHAGRVSAEGLALLDESVAPIVTRMRAIVDEGQREGSIRPELDPDTLLGQYAYTLRAVMNRVLYPGHSFARFEAASFVTDYIDLFLRGIAAHPEVPL